MRILYIITQADGGGAQKYTLALAKAFGGMIAAGTENQTLFEHARKAGLETFPLEHLKRQINLWNDFLAAWEIRELVKELKPDIVHLNSSKAGILGSFACIGLKSKTAPRTGQQNWTGTRVVFTAHGFVFNEPLGFAQKNFYLALEKIASDYRDYIIAVSDADKNSALGNNLIKPNKISTIHNGIGPIDFLSANEARRLLNLPNHKLIFGCVANFYKTKGLDILIDAIALLDESQRQKIQVVVIGDGPEEKDLRLKMEDLRLGNSIKLLGKIDAAASYLRAFDCFVLPSRKEGFSYTLLEAMQAGLPIIATDAGGNKEALGDAGMLIKAENPKALAGAISYFIGNEQKRKDLSQKARSRQELFTETKMLEETKRIYDQLLQSL